jgi:predicted porin
MKKSLLVIAGCGIATGACAQSTLTIYGNLDLGVSKLNNGDSTLTGLPTGLIGTPGVWSLRPSTSNRIGFRGTEDLGGGWRTGFSIEHRIASDTGGTQFGQTGFWGGHSWVGLGNPLYGEVRLGRQFVPAHYVAAAGDPWAFDYNVGGAYGFTKAGSTYTYAANSVGYKSPDFGGLTGEVVVGAREGGTAVNPANNPGRTWSAALIYNKSPLYVGLGYNNVRTEGPVKNEFAVFTASYDFGLVKPIFSYSVGKPSTVRTNRSYLIGAIMPLGAGRLKAVVARLDPAGGDNNTTKFGLGYEYFLSKRTSLHADVGTASTEERRRSNGVEAGIKHVF